MDQVTEWQRTCEHGTAHEVCTTCAGGLHPVLNATVRHLQRVIADKQSHLNLGELLKLSMETDALFAEIDTTLADLKDVEELAGETDAAAAREKRDIGIIATDVHNLVSRFEQLVPDIRDHEISTGVRSMQSGAL